MDMKSCKRIQNMSEKRIMKKFKKGVKKKFDFTQKSINIDEDEGSGNSAQGSLIPHQIHFYLLFHSDYSNFFRMHNDFVFAIDNHMTITKWNYKTGKLVRTYQGHTGSGNILQVQSAPAV